MVEVDGRCDQLHMSFRCGVLNTLNLLEGFSDTCH